MCCLLLRCSPWSRCWGISCWCTWWQIPWLYRSGRTAAVWALHTTGRQVFFSHFSFIPFFVCLFLFWSQKLENNICERKTMFHPLFKELRWSWARILASNWVTDRKRLQQLKRVSAEIQTFMHSNFNSVFTSFLMRTNTKCEHAHGYVFYRNVGRNRAVKTQTGGTAVHKTITFSALFSHLTACATVLKLKVLNQKF